MTTEQERAELHRTIWAIANELRGSSLEVTEFKFYVLGFLFYRYLSEKIEKDVNEEQHRAGYPAFSYADLNDSEAQGPKDAIINKVGFFLLPSELFCNMRRRADEKADDEDTHLNEEMKRIFDNITASSRQNMASEKVFNGLFGEVRLDDEKNVGKGLEANKTIRALLSKIGDMKLGDFSQNQNDVFGDAYEFLIKMYATKAGNKGGEFYTPQEVSRLLALITSNGRSRIDRVYDPACGSGSLLLQFAKVLGLKNVRRFYGQELKTTTYNLCRMNMLLHGVDFDRIRIANGDTLKDPDREHLDIANTTGFDAIVSNPPYSTHWKGKSDPLLISDERFSPAGVLAPESKADLAFTMHILHYLAVSGTAAIVEFPGVLYRGAAEQKIRQYLVDQNNVDTVIQLPQNLFFGVTIATCIIVLKKNRHAGDGILFIDASEQFVHKGNKNKLCEDNIQAIFKAYAGREEQPHFAHTASIQEVRDNGYNLSVSSYVEQRDTREQVDIAQLNREIEEIVARQAGLRKQIEEIVARLES